MTLASKLAQVPRLPAPREEIGRLLRAEDVAEITGLSVETLAQWRSQRRGIPFVKLSRTACGTGRSIWTGGLRSV
jgi:hypothetical protein